MHKAVIDIGSNTVKMTVFDVKNANLFCNIHIQKFPTKLFSCLECGFLSEEGIKKIIDALENFKKTAAFFGCEEILCFSTAVLRKAENAKAVLVRVKQETGINIDVLSSEAEAYCSFMGLRHSIAAHADGNNGVMIDLGGGSTEIIAFEGEQIKSSTSLSFGCLSLADRFCSGILPSLSECADINKFVSAELIETTDIPECFSNKGFPAYLIGGTAQALAVLKCYIDNTEYEYKNFIFEPDVSVYIMEYLKKEQNAEAVIGKLLPDRIRTVLPGIIAYSAVLKYLGCSSVNVVDCGVREGYLFVHLRKK